MDADRMRFSKHRVSFSLLITVANVRNTFYFELELIMNMIVKFSNHMFVCSPQTQNLCLIYLPTADK